MIYLILAVIILSAAVFFCIKHIFKLKKSLGAEKERADAYRDELYLVQDMQKKFADIDYEIERKKNERKKLSKTDKINVANNRA